MNESDVTRERRATGFPLRMLALVLIAQVAGIMLTMMAMMPVGLLFGLVYAAGRSEWAASIVSFDSFGLIRLAAYIVPPCLWWWLYTKFMRKLAKHLNLAVAGKELGFPFIGEIAFVAGLMGLR